MTMQKKIKGFLAASFLGATALAGMPQAYSDTPPAAPVNSLEEALKTNPALQMSYINGVIDIARGLHVDKAKTEDGEKIIAAAINGVLKELDPHSSYLTPKQYQSMREGASGEFAGVGFTVSTETKKLIIVETMKNSPAERSGLKPDDHITHIDGKPTQDMSVEDAVKLMRGKPKTPVTLTIARSPSKPFDVKVTRDTIRVEAVNSKMIGSDIGYIQISTFHNNNVDKELNDAVSTLKKNNNVKAYVIDLRNNPGGYLHMANAISDAFIDSKQIILSVKGREANDVEKYYAKPGDIADGKPIVVLVNEGSASASEIVAGALQDTGRATILGTQSYGKGSVQTVVPLKSGAALKVTIARYYTAAGRSIQNHGITPDIGYLRNAEDLKPTIKPESEQNNTLQNLDAAGTDKTETKENCAAITTTPTIVIDPALKRRSGKIDFELACAVERLRNTSDLTVRTPYTAPAAAPKP